MFQYCSPVGRVAAPRSAAAVFGSPLGAARGTSICALCVVFCFCFSRRLLPGSAPRRRRRRNIERVVGGDSVHARTHLGIMPISPAFLSSVAVCNGTFRLAYSLPHERTFFSRLRSFVLFASANLEVQQFWEPAGLVAITWPLRCGERFGRAQLSGSSATVCVDGRIER